MTNPIVNAIKVRYNVIDNPLRNRGDESTANSINDNV